MSQYSNNVCTSFYRHVKDQKCSTTTLLHEIKDVLCLPYSGWAFSCTLNGWGGIKLPPV